MDGVSASTNHDKQAMKHLEQPVTALFTKDTDGYFAEARYLAGFGSQAGPTSVFATGLTIDATLNDLIEGANLAFSDIGRQIAREDVHIVMDLPSFFEHYKVINVKALSKRLGMNQSLLSQYINGKKRASEKQTMRILAGVRDLGRELSDIEISP
jgi:hypothetical protein